MISVGIGLHHERRLPDVRELITVEPTGIRSRPSRLHHQAVRAGTHYYRVYKGADIDHLAWASPTRAVRVR